MSSQGFAGRSILITGGTRGIGRATALRLAGEGARITVNYLSRRAEAESLIAEIQNAGGKCTAVSGDVSKPEDAQRIVDVARDAFGPIDMLVHCAAYSVVEPATDVTWESWKKTMNVNLDGTYNMVYAVKDEMIARKFGRIVTISSIAALRERENQVHYSASKAAVIAFTRCVAQAWAKHNIRVNCMCPGLVETEMAHVLSDEAHKSIIAQTPMGRIGQPDEIASVIRFLLSDESSFMTGQTVVASGGRVMLPG